ncbi:MAG: FxsA family protein [Acidimicrobiales bacterium]
MFLALFFVFVVFPLIELGVVVAVAGWIGILPTIAALIAMSAIGVWLVKREGLGMMRSTRLAIDRGEVPGAQLLDGATLALAGLLCIVPGFLSGTIGLLLLIGPIRRRVGRRLVRRWTRLTSFSGFTRPRPDVIEVEWIGDITPPVTSNPADAATPEKLGPADD